MEKHVPVSSASKDYLTIRVGNQPHPMFPKHYIKWIYIQCKLFPSDGPKAGFPVKQEEILGVYAFFEQHGLWKAGSCIKPCLVSQASIPNVRLYCPASSGDASP